MVRTGRVEMARGGGVPARRGSRSSAVGLNDSDDAAAGSV
jgi:hypothetical protein